MTSIFRQKIIIFLEFIHQKIFGHEMSNEMKSFLGHLSWSFFGGTIASAILFIVNIIVGRWLGPQEYGKFNLVLILGQIFCIPMILGFDAASARAISRDRNNLKKYISASFYFILISIVVTSFIIFLLSSEIAQLVSADNRLVYISLVVGIFLGIKLLLDGFIRGINNFKYQSVIKISDAFVVLTTLILASIFLDKTSYLVVVAATIVGSFVSLTGFFVKIYKYLVDFDYIYFKKLFKYGKFVVLGSIISLAVVYSDKIFVNKYLGTYELGIYMAYFTASITFISQFSAVFSNVYFPIISKTRDKRVIFDKINRLFLVGFFPVFLFIFTLTLIIIKLFGKDYSFDFKIASLFSLLGVLQFFTPFYSNIVNAHSYKTYKWGLFLYAIRAVFFILYIFTLIYFDMFSIITLLIGIILNYVADIINLKFIIKKYCYVQ